MHPFKPDLLKGEVALVTGGTAGIGKAIALAFAAHGAKVIIFGTNAERGAQVSEEIKKLSQQQDNGRFYQVDIAKTESVDQAIAEIIKIDGKVDILVNNAGITRDQLLMKMSEEDWDKVLEVNVKSCYNTCRALVRPMMKAKKGTIINVSSIVGLIGNPGQTNYAAAKAAMIGFTKALAKEIASRNVRVNCICPGFIETGMTDALNDQQKQGILTSIPMGRIGAPKEIAHTALFLASDCSTYITGQTLVVDGGMAM